MSQKEMSPRVELNNAESLAGREIGGVKFLSRWWDLVRYVAGDIPGEISHVECCPFCSAIVRHSDDFESYACACGFAVEYRDSTHHTRRVFVPSIWAEKYLG